MKKKEKKYLADSSCCYNVHFRLSDIFRLYEIISNIEESQASKVQGSKGTTPRTLNGEP